MSVAIDGTVRQWSLIRADLTRAAAESKAGKGAPELTDDGGLAEDWEQGVGKDKDEGNSKSGEKSKQTVKLTAEEEAELEALMMECEDD